MPLACWYTLIQPPTPHTTMACSSVVEQLTVNQPVAGSNPAGPVEEVE